MQKQNQEANIHSKHGRLLNSGDAKGSDAKAICPIITSAKLFTSLSLHFKGYSREHIEITQN